MADEYEPSGDLMALLEEAINHAMGSVEDGGVLIPFVMASRGDEREVTRFIVNETDTTWNAEKSVEKARAAARKLGGKADMAIVMFDGILRTDDGKKFDAFYAECFESGAPCAVVAGQRYQHKTADRGFTLWNDPILLDELEPFWK